MAQYTLRTIKDIFDKIPVDRLETCMKELTTLLIQSKGMGELISAAAYEPHGLASTWVFPDEIVWNDDGAGTVQSNMHVGAETLVVKTTHSKEEICRLRDGGEGDRSRV